MSDKCVHTEHCCIIHGCKYGDDDCPVVTGEKAQSYQCESCGFDAQEWIFNRISKAQVAKELQRMLTLENLKKENELLKEQIRQLEAEKHELS